jgi:hypothetical protein
VEWDCKKTFNQEEMKLNERSKGLGDTVEKITTATGIKKVVEGISKATGKDCGCKQRKDALNRMFPYKDKK